MYVAMSGAFGIQSKMHSYEFDSELFKGISVQVLNQTGHAVMSRDVCKAAFQV